MNAEQDRLVRQQISSLLYGGDVVAAEALSQEHLKRRPRDHEAMALLAHVRLTMGQYGEAERLLMRALAQDAKRSDYQSLLAEVFTTTGRHREALIRYDKALKIQPGFEGAVAGKAEVFLRMGKPEKARRVIEASGLPLDQSPALTIPWVRALSQTGDLARAEAAARQHVPSDTIQLEHRRSLWHALGMVLEKRESFGEALEAHAQANGLASQGFDAQAAADQRRLVEEFFSQQRFETLPRSECQDDSPVFIVGMPRSGSTLTEQIIDAHPGAAGLGELNTLSIVAAALPEILSTALPYPACLEETNECSLRVASMVYLDDITSRAPRATRRIDKQLGNFTMLGLIALLFPRARVIHCQRHPLDVGLSCFSQKFAPGTNTWASRYEDIAAFYHEYEAWMDHWRATLPIPMLELRYEDLARDVQTQARRIIDFCELDWDDRCLRFWETGRTVLTLSSGQVRQPMYTSSINRHQAFGEQLKPLRDALGQSVARYDQQP